MGELSAALSNTLPVTIGGQDYTVSKITVGILADFETAMAARDLSRGLKALGEATPAERAEFIWQSQNRQGGDSMDRLTTAEGMRVMLWLMLREGGHDMSEADVGRMLTLEAIPEITALFRVMFETGNVDIPGESPNAETTTVEAGIPSSPA